MRNTTPAVGAPAKLAAPIPNRQKGLSYAEAWRRIKRANENGYFLESVTICESLISDRLLSYILRVRVGKQFNERTAFAKLIVKWRELIKTSDAHVAEVAATLDLVERVDAWRGQRNAVVHALAKSMPRTPTKDVDAFLLEAETAAKTGALLAREVLRWDRRNSSAIC